MKTEKINDVRGGQLWPLVAADLKPGFTVTDLMNSIVRVAMVHETLAQTLEESPVDLSQKGVVKMRICVNSALEICMVKPDPGEVIEPAPIPKDARLHETGPFTAPGSRGKRR